MRFLPGGLTLKKAAVRMRITSELYGNGRFRAGSKSSPTCCGAFGPERRGSFGFFRALSLL